MLFNVSENVEFVQLYFLLLARSFGFLIFVRFCSPFTRTVVTETTATARVLEIPGRNTDLALRMNISLSLPP